MTKLLISLFIRDYENTNDALVRKKYGTLSALVGVVCNLILFALKLTLGIISASIAVVADAFNNLSDVGSSVATFLGFHLASKPADREHPYGHGRFEYISGLFIAVLILLVGFEFAKGSIEKIISPSQVTFSPIVVFGLIASIAVKLWLARFNNTLGRKIGSASLTASAADSISDVFSTSVTLIAIIAARYTDLPIDGYMGVIVSALVLYTGYTVARDTISPLLGGAPDPELCAKIRAMTLSYEGILGVHDLIVHDYGPGRIFASLHAEVSVERDVVESHALIDCIENEMAESLGIQVLIHMDPLDLSCPQTAALRALVEGIVHAECAEWGVHDFRMVDSGAVKNLIFDVTVPIEEKLRDAEIIEKISMEVCRADEKYQAKIMVDRVV